MSFEAKQIRRLRARLNPKHIRTREADGTLLNYLEGWFVVSEANRIFGFDGWDRETVASQCVWTKQLGMRFAAAYVARVRITVRAGTNRIVREGSGSSESLASSPGEAHEVALKSAETDATKRALSTFGNAFGLSLYGPLPEVSPPRLEGKTTPPNDTVVPSQARVDKSELSIAEPKRLKDPEHLKYVAAQPCLVCDRKPAHAHHLTFAQPRAMGRKVSDEFTVPLCNVHHNDLHTWGNERLWWANKKLEPIRAATDLWKRSRS